MYKLYYSYSPCRTSLYIPNSYSLNFDGLKRTKLQLLKLQGHCFHLVYLLFCELCVLRLQKGKPQWLKLQEAESGEIQVQFKVSIPGEQVKKF